MLSRRFMYLLSNFSANFLDRLVLLSTKVQILTQRLGQKYKY